MASPSTQPDYLDEDPVTVTGQTYALVSFVTPRDARADDKGKAPEGAVAGGQVALKIRGCFATKEEASAHVRRLQRLDPQFDIYLVDMYKWLAIPPNPDAIEEQQYQETFLNDLIKGYKESQLLARQHFEERKRAVMEGQLDPAADAGAGSGSRLLKGMM